MKKLLVVLGVLALTVPFAAHGAEAITSQTPYSLSQGTALNTNLYYAGQMAGVYGNVNGDVSTIAGSVDITGNVSGNVFAGGGSINISGNVGGSVMAAGGSVNISGNVGGTVRAAGGSIMISGTVNGDLAVAGGSVNILPTAVIKGDLLLGGGSANVQGKILGGIKSGAREVTINNSVGGASDINVEDLYLGPQAVLNGLTYHSYTEAKIDPSAQVNGPINFDKKTNTPVQPATWGFGAILGLGILIKFLMLLAVGLVFAYFFKKFSGDAVRGSMATWMNVWRGFVFVVLAPIIALILTFTLIGIPLAGLVLLAYFFTIILAYFMAVIASGTWVSRWIWKRETLDWKTALLGVVVWIILGWIPILGWIAKCLLVLAAVGSVHSFLHREVWSKR